MHVALLGTGSADRWPNPWCSCERCAWARAHGAHRARTSALVDDVLLIDPGPDVGSGGTDLTGVRAVLVTHDHPDHLDPAFLLAWTWAGAAPLVVAGPAQAVDRCRAWVAPDAPVTFRALEPGDALALAGLTVRALPAAHATDGGLAHDGTALLYEVVGEGRLLYATDTAALPFEALAEGYDLVLLECTFGEVGDHGTAHLDLASFGHEVAQLRAGGHLARGGRVVAVHLSHHNPVDLAARLDPIGAEVLPDGSVLRIGTDAARPGRRLLVTGGARSGKSARAEAVAAGRSPVTYVATAPAHPEDPEWVRRVADHRARRPGHWRTVETTDLPALLATTPGETCVVVDCLGLWVTGVVDRVGAWESPEAASAAVGAELAALLDALGAAPADVVLVTNEVGSGVVPATVSGRLFQDLLGRVNAAVAAACDDVELVVCGIARSLKGTAWTTTST
jgi:adenosylcobinamide kinase / adenosylcobinamide-phosphate guanylyltransferase